MSATPASPRDSWLWGFLTVFLACLGAGCAWTWIQAPEAPPYRSVSGFTFTNQLGAPVSAESLRGQVWIASFFFTHCSESCPKQTEALGRLQERLRRSGVRLAAFSVQPEKDSVARLQAYGEANQADPTRWWFLTGEKAAIQRLALQDFTVSVQENPAAPAGQQVSHTAKFFLVDRDGTIRFRSAEPGRMQVGWEVVEEVRSDPEPAPPGQRQFAINEGELRRLALAAIELDQGWIPFAQLPLINALLNSTAAVLLLTGFFFIRRRMIAAHAVCMIGALAVSAAFLASYLHYHYYAGDTPFRGQGPVRTFYFALLISHVVLAIVILPLVLLTFWRAWRRQWVRHAALGRWTLPLWAYVSVTGLLVYLFLYKFYPG